MKCLSLQRILLITVFMKHTITLLTAALMLMQISCTQSESETKKHIETTTTHFAEAYFNYDFKLALKYSAPESYKWIRYAATNVTESDLEKLRSKEENATVGIERIEMNNTDSTGIVTIKVNDYLCQDTIGQPGHIIECCTFRIPVVIRENRCLVKMEGPLRSEKRNPD